MKMTLVVENTDNLSSSLPHTCSFGEEGGVIGSEANCDWVLRDRAFSVGESHVQIFIGDGMFCASCLHENGVVVNRSNRPILPGQPFQIRDGDHWRVGDFEVSVFVASENDVDGGRWVNRYSSVESIVSGELSGHDGKNKAEAEDILLRDPKGKSFRRPTKKQKVPETNPIVLMSEQLRADGDSIHEKNPLRLLDDEGGPPKGEIDKELLETLELENKISEAGLNLPNPMPQEEFIKMQRPKVPPKQARNKANSKPPIPPRKEEKMSDNPISSENPISLEDNIIDAYLTGIEESGAKPGKARDLKEISERDAWLPRDKQRDSGGEEEMIDHVLLRPLLAEMDLQVKDLTGPEGDELLRQIGATMRTVVTKLIRMRNIHGIDRNLMNQARLHLVEDNPLRLSDSIEEVMHNLFLNNSPVHLKAGDAIAESLDEIETHEVASKEAIECALQAVLENLSPTRLESRFKLYRGHGPKIGEPDSWNWQMYGHYYDELKSDYQNGLSRMFWEVYRQVHDKKMRDSTKE